MKLYFTQTGAINYESHHPLVKKKEKTRKSWVVFMTRLTYLKLGTSFWWVKCSSKDQLRTIFFFLFAYLQQDSVLHEHLTVYQTNSKLRIKIPLYIFRKLYRCNFPIVECVKCKRFLPRDFHYSLQKMEKNVYYAKIEGKGKLKLTYVWYIQIGQIVVVKTIEEDKEVWGGEQNGQRVFSAALSNLLLPVVNGETSSTLFSCVCFQR